jgi:hypothetical protein
MPEIKPDLSEWSRCISVHWSLPVQCVLPCTHRENWHEAWHPGTGNRIRYRRSMGVYATEDFHHDAWHDLEIPPPSETDGSELAAKRLARISEWANGDAVMAKSSFGDGYREAMRDIRDLVNGGESR